MIDIKIIRKPKNEGSTGAVNTSSTAYGGMSVKEAAHAAKADLAEQAKEARHAADASHADKADEATHAAEADHALEADHAKEADHATEADNADKWDYKEFADYLDQPVRKSDNVQFGSLETDVIRSAGTFVDGLLGEGFRLWREVDSGGKALTYLCLDKLTVRQTMTVMELLIQKVRSVGGMIVVSAANGRVKSVGEDGEYYVLTFEEGNTYVAHDLLRCQTFTGTTLKSYWVEVSEADETTVKVLRSEFGTSQPEAGDDTVLMGNTENTARQNMVLISATEDGQPRVDVMDGVKTKSFAGALRARLGNLDGINDDAFPSDRQPQGNGLYSDNAYLKGTFLLVTGEDVKTRFEIMEGKVESELTGIRDDFTSEKGYLSNPAFADGMAKWNTRNETVFFLVGNKWIWANGNVLTKKGDCASVTKDQGRTVVLIRNKYIEQKRGNLRVTPSFEANADGEKQALPVYLSFFYRCRTAGTLKVAFENVDKTGFADFESMSVEETLEATEGYQQYTCSGLWNGTGDFRLSFTGEIYLYMLILSTDKVESLTYKYRTLLEQSEKLVKIAAQNFDKDGKPLAESGFMVKADGSGIYAQTADGKLALIGVGIAETDAEGNEKTVIKLTADNIKLEGLVTANGNFKILEDGSIETVNASISGKISATSGEIAGFSISGNGLTNIVPETDMDNGNMGYIICRNDHYGRFAGIGANVLPSMSGAAAVARFENNDTHSWYTQNIAMMLQARGQSTWGYGTGTKNIACATYGGCFTGFALGVKIVDCTSAAKTVTLTESDNVVTVIGSNDCIINLPEAHPYDDGHVLIIKRDGDTTVKVVPNTYVDSASTSRESYIRYDRGSVACGKSGSVSLSSWMDSMMLIFHAGLNVQQNNTTYYGCWIQYKLPRDW